MLTNMMRWFPCWTLLLAVAAYLLPSAFVGIGPHIWLLLGLIMLAMGLTLTVADFKRILIRPAPIAAGLVLQFLVMPTVAWALAQLFGMPPDLAAGMILLGSVAGGTASNVVAYLARGDVALSVTMTTLSTLVGVIATPLLVELLVDASIEVEVQGLLMSIVKMVLLPVALGLSINTFCHRAVRRIEAYLPLLSMLCIALTIAAIAASSQNALATVGVTVFAGIVLHNAIGLCGGYWGGRLLGFDATVCRTLAIEVGMQNSGLAVALAKLHFGLLASLPGAMTSIWQVLSGAMLAAYWRARPPPSHDDI